MKRRTLWLIPLAVLLTAPAFAASPANPGAGATLFNDGVELRKKGQWADALDRFQRSQELQPSVGALINIGDCYKELDKPASAWGAYREAENLAARLKDDRESVAHKRAETIQPKVAHVTLTVPKIEGLTVTRSGTKVDPATYDTQVPIDHGSYTIEASAPNHKPWTGKLDVAPGATAKLTIPDLEAMPAPVPGPELTPKPLGDESSTQRTVGIGLEIGGGAVLAAGLVFGVLTMGSWSSAEEQCPKGKCPTEDARDASASAADRASTFGLISTVGVIAGAAMLVGGVVLHLTAPKKQAVGLYGLSFRFQ